MYILISALLLVHCALSVDNDETEYGIKDRVCPYASPIKCSSGWCCNFSQFCGSAGKCESCFPSEIPEPERLAWCRETGQHNVSSMGNPVCRLACQDLYTSLQLAVCEVNDTKITSRGHEEPSTISPTEATPKESQTETALKGRLAREEHFLIAIVSIVSLILIILLSILVFILLRRFLKERRKDTSNTTETRNTETGTTGNADPASLREDAENVRAGRALHNEERTPDDTEPVPESANTGNRDQDEIVNPAAPLIQESHV